MFKRSEVIIIIIFYILGFCVELFGFGWDNKFFDSVFIVLIELSLGERREIYD